MTRMWKICYHYSSYMYVWQIRRKEKEHLCILFYINLGHILKIKPNRHEDIRLIILGATGSVSMRNETTTSIYKYITVIRCTYTKTWENCNEIYITFFFCHVSSVSCGKKVKMFPLQQYKTLIKKLHNLTHILSTCAQKNSPVNIDFAMLKIATLI